MSEGTIVTFYSYKGGVGRTFALANIGALLSLWGYKILCIDWDLEAPGLHLYFKQWLKEENIPGLTEMIQAYSEGKKPRWQNFVTEVNFSGSLHPLQLMKAGLQDKSYVQRIQKLDWNTLYSEHDLGNFLEELRENWKQFFDFVLIDSRTGISDIGGICTIQLPDILMLLLPTNEQSLNGSLEVLERIHETRAKFPFDRAKLLVTPVVSRFERRVEYNLADQWLARFANLFPPIYNNWVHKDISATDLLNYIRIPYIPYWSFGEMLPVIERGTSDPEDIGYYLETLAALVAHNLSSTDILIKNRDSFVAMVKRWPTSLNKEWILLGEYDKGSFHYYGIINSTNIRTIPEHADIVFPAIEILLYTETLEGTCAVLQERTIYNSANEIGTYSNISSRLCTDDVISLSPGRFWIDSTTSDLVASRTFDAFSGLSGGMVLDNIVWRIGAVRTLQEQFGLDIHPDRLDMRASHYLKREHGDLFYQIFSLKLRRDLEIDEWEMIQQQRPYAALKQLRMSELQQLHSENKLNRLLQVGFADLFLPLFEQIQIAP
jgi:cellulose biosynthesis protein BcsQ